jgi:hypothetical protein
VFSLPPPQVIDESPDQLWTVARQRDLMLQRGCCVQLEVAFGASEAARPQRFLLEASVDGAALSEVENDDAVGVSGELTVCVADLNGITGGSFWAAATEATPWRDAMRGRF